MLPGKKKGSLVEVLWCCGLNLETRKPGEGLVGLILGEMSGWLSAPGSLVEGTGYFTEEVRGDKKRPVGGKRCFVEGTGLIGKLLKQHPLQGNAGIHHHGMVHSLLERASRSCLITDQEGARG